MTAPELRKGEQVEITMSAKVLGTISGSVAVSVAGHGLKLVPDVLDAITVTRTAPAQWPPKLADVWEAGDGQRWVAVAHDEFEDGLVLMRLDASTRRTYYAPSQWIDGCGPATLAYRVGYDMPCWHTELPDADDEDGDEACTGEVPTGSLEWLTGALAADHGDREHVGPERIRIGDLIVVNTAPRIVVEVDPGIDGTPFEIYHRNRGGPLRTLSVHKGGQVERIRTGDTS